MSDPPSAREQARTEHRAAHTLAIALTLIAVAIVPIALVLGNFASIGASGDSDRAWAAISWPLSTCVVSCLLTLVAFVVSISIAWRTRWVGTPIVSGILSLLLMFPARWALWFW